MKKLLLLLFSLLLLIATPSFAEQCETITPGQQGAPLMMVPGVGKLPGGEGVRDQRIGIPRVHASDEINHESPEQRTELNAVGGIAEKQSHQGSDYRNIQTQEKLASIIGMHPEDHAAPRKDAERVQVRLIALMQKTYLDHFMEVIGNPVRALFGPNKQLEEQQLQRESLMMQIKEAGGRGCQNELVFKMLDRALEELQHNESEHGDGTETGTASLIRSSLISAEQAKELDSIWSQEEKKQQDGILYRKLRAPALEDEFIKLVEQNNPQDAEETADVLMKVRSIFNSTSLGGETNIDGELLALAEAQGSLIKMAFYYKIFDTALDEIQQQQQELFRHGAPPVLSDEEVADQCIQVVKSSSLVVTIPQGERMDYCLKWALYRYVNADILIHIGHRWNMIHGDSE